MTPSNSNSVIPLAANSPTAFTPPTNHISAPGIFSYGNGGFLTVLNGNRLAYNAEKQSKLVQGLGISETIAYDGAGAARAKGVSGFPAGFRDGASGGAGQSAKCRNPPAVN